MGRSIVLSNGQLFVGLNDVGLVHDFYYPYVGLDNLTNARSAEHKIGVWVDGAFDWITSASWDVTIQYEQEAQISTIVMRSRTLNITVRTHDFVDPESNAFIRRITITNDAAHERDIRLFMHQVFQISRAGRADTAMFVPDDNYILDYKGRCCLLTAGKIIDGGDFDQFAIGNFRIEGKAGTFKDAEDGELSGNAIEHGGVDSVLRFRKQVPAGRDLAVDYWIVAADSQSDAQVVHTHIKYSSMDERIQKARDFWQAWLAPSEKLRDSLPAEYQTALQQSLLIIRAHCDTRGSVLASGDSSIFNYGRDYYCYCWPRDGAYAVWPLIKTGHLEEAQKFFDFMRDVKHRDGYLMHKYQPDRAIGSTWHPLLHGRHKELAIQEDETASVIYMIGEFYKASQDRAYIESLYDTFIDPCASFLSDFVDDATGLPHASYDLWEQKFQTSTYTVCTVIAALETASGLAEELDHPDAAVRWQNAAARFRNNLNAFFHPDGYFRKGFLLQESGNIAFDDTIDIATLYGLFRYSGLPIDDTRITRTAQAVEQHLLNTTPIGGVIRYEHDGYFLAKRHYKGNPWIVCTLWLAQYYIAVDDNARARELLGWALARRGQSGVLSEQFDPDTGYALSVTPLVWSHAETVNTILELSRSNIK